VALDEDTEIAVLAEVEREIFVGMEALENAFENLHWRAETVRKRMRERGAGLAIQSHIRRGGAAYGAGPEVRGGTPTTGTGFDHVLGRMDNDDAQTDDGLNDAQSEILPDDSASNISYNRRTRRKAGRYHHSREAEPLIEEDGEDGYTGQTGTIKELGKSSKHAHFTNHNGSHSHSRHGSRKVSQS